MLLTMLLLGSCRESNQTVLHQAQDRQAAQDWPGALEKWEQLQSMDPASRIAVFGKARAQYELKQYDEALALFEEFLKLTESERASYKGERYDAEFYRDKIRQEKGEVVEQNPEAIPPPPMGE
jgi:tetratricopeptide (TPR) repeat protein